MKRKSTLTQSKVLALALLFTLIYPKQAEAKRFVYVKTQLTCLGKLEDESIVQAALVSNGNTPHSELWVVKNNRLMHKQGTYHEKARDDWDEYRTLSFLNTNSVPSTNKLRLKTIEGGNVIGTFRESSFEPDIGDVLNMQCSWGPSTIKFEKQ